MFLSILKVPPEGVLPLTGAEPGSGSWCSRLPATLKAMTAVSAESLSMEGLEQKSLMLLCTEEEDFIGSAVQIQQLRGT